MSVPEVKWQKEKKIEKKPHLKFLPDFHLLLYLAKFVRLSIDLLKYYLPLY